MHIKKHEIPDHRARVIDCKRFINDFVIMVVQVSVNVGVYKYARHGSLSDWKVVFKVACDESYDIQRVIDSVSAATQQNPILL